MCRHQPLSGWESNKSKFEQMLLTRNRLALIASLKLERFTNEQIIQIWTKYQNGLHYAIKQNGKHYALERYKASYGFLRNFVLNLKTPNIPFCRVDKRGIPKTLWALRPLLKGNREELRLALTIARTYEEIYLPLNIDLDAIEGPSHYGKDSKKHIENFEKFLVKFTNKYPRYLGTLQNTSKELKVFTTTASGPNGPAVAAAHLDALAVKNDKEVYDNLREFNQALGQDHITQWLDISSKSFEPDGRILYTGRLGASAEPGGKTRLFAIGDYWTQTSLKPIQVSLYRTLKSISTDCTANQNLGFKSLISISNTKPTYCFDLSSASDRIPAEMQRHRLNLMSGKNLGDVWVRVMKNRTFFMKTINKDVRWNVGQPLGLLSSFPSFSLWHHDIIQYSANLENFDKGKPLKFFTEYRLLGDDVVIFNKKVADNYTMIMGSLGIPINLSKSIIGVNGDSQIEFTKRLALKGMEMSSIKNNILTKNSVLSTLDLVDLLYERDFILPPDTGHYGLFRDGSLSQNEILSMFLWYRSDSDVPFKWDQSDFLITRNELTTKVKELRAQRIQEKVMEVFSMLDSAEPISTHYKSISLPCSDKALGLTDGFPSNQFELHPIVWAVNQVGLELNDILSTIWDESNDVEPVEYLPIPGSKVYFNQRKLRGEYLSKLIIDSYQEIVKIKSQ